MNRYFSKKTLGLITVMSPATRYRFAVWKGEAQKTSEMLKMLPAGQYDFRPDCIWSFAW
jgi:hypothetical protein